MQYLFVLFGVAVLLGVARTVASWLRRRRYPDQFDKRPIDPRYDYSRSDVNVTKYTRSWGDGRNMRDQDTDRDY